MDIIAGLLKRILDAISDPQPVSPWLTATQADSYVRQSRGTISRLCKAGIIESRKVGKARYVHTDWLDEWILSQPSGKDETFKALHAMGTRDTAA